MEQQARILRGFLEQLERQEAVDDEAKNGIAGEFMRLKSQSTRYRTEKTFPTKTAEKQENNKKNRYKDIVPFDHSRVKLSLTTSKTDTDYINASFIKGVSGSRAYIATQGPLPHTVVDFLRMLWEYNVKVVVMACREFEMGKKKCEVYWPQKQTQPFVCEPFKVYCDSEENKGDYLSRTLRVTYRNGTRTLKQLHYVNWPDHGVPDSIPPILDMIQEMRSTQDHDDIPLCIHCSAGCGRTGALCVIDYTWNLLKKQMITKDFSIYDLVQDMRTQRPSVVQTKEQYELVYRTIRLLFQRYLEAMEVQPCQNEVAVDQFPISPVSTESDLSYLNEDFSSLMPHFQYLLDEERHLVPSQYHTSPASEPLIDLKTQETLWDQWDVLQTPDALSTTQDLNKGPTMLPKLVLVSQGASAAEERRQECDGQNPPPAMAEAICHMVEDPYFDFPGRSPSLEETPVEDTERWTLSPTFSSPSLCLNGQTLDPNSTVSGCDEEAPPPLPERTPESYQLAVDKEVQNTCELLVIPPNAAAEAIRELGGSPPSPVPPLPERTPESFELAINQAPVEKKPEVPPAVNMSVIGLSSEWSGNSQPAAATLHTETKPFMRSKSLKVKMNFSAPEGPVNPSLIRMSNFYPYCPPVEPQIPPQPPQTDGHVTPPLPDRTPESFILPAEQTHVKTTPTTQPSLRVGVSSEWDGTAQPKKFLDVVMNRSKSVKAKSSKQETLTAFQPLAPPPVVGAEGGSAAAVDPDGIQGPSLNTERPGTKPDKNEKGMSRTRSLKFFNKHKPKPKTAPPPPPSQPGAPSSVPFSALSVFRFGFGNRFGKPKGPRAYPEAWI